MKEINIGIVGYGGMGEYHERELIKNNSHVKVVGVYDIEKSRRDLASSKGLTIYNTYEELLRNENIAPFKRPTTVAANKPNNMPGGPK